MNTCTANSGKSHSECNGENTLNFKVEGVTKTGSPGVMAHVSVELLQCLRGLDALIDKGFDVLAVSLDHVRSKLFRNFSLDFLD